MLERSLRLKERHFGADHFAPSSTRVNLADLYRRCGDARQAQQMLERALGTLEQHYGPDHVEVASTLESLASAHSSLSDNQAAQRLLERALMTKEQHFGPDHVEVSVTLNNLALVYGAFGDARTARELLLRALRITERYYGELHVEVAPTVLNVAMVEAVLGEHAHAAEARDRGIVCLRSMPSAHLIAGLVKASTVLCAAGELEDARMHVEESFVEARRRGLPVAPCLDALRLAAGLYGRRGPVAEFIQQYIHQCEATAFSPDWGPVEAR